MTNSANMGNGNNNDDATKLPPPSTTAMENTSSSSSNMGNRSSGDHSDNIRTAQLIQALRLGQHNLLGGRQHQDILGQQQNINASASNNPLPGTITNVGSFASSSSTAAVHPSMLPVENTAIANASLPSQEDGSHDHEATSDSEDDDNDGEDHDEEDIMQDVVTSSNIDVGATTTTHTTSSGTAAASSQNPHETEEFKRPARAVFEKYNQCKRTLGVLMLGSNDNELSPDVFQKFPFKDIPNSYRLYVPQQGDYVAEINRRSHFLAKEAHSANDRRAIFKGISRGRHPRPKNWTVPKCREWLADPAHYIGTAEDKQFLLETIAELKRQAQMQILLGTNSSNRTVEAAAAAGAETDGVCSDEKLCCAGDHHHHDHHHSNTIPLTTSATISSHSTAALPEVVLESSHEPVGGEKRKAAIALEERDKNISHDHQQQHSISNTNTARKSQQQQQPHLPPPQQQPQPQPQQRVMNKAAIQKDLSAVRAIVASHDDELQRQQHETAALRQELQDQKAQTAALQQQVTRMEQILDFHRLSGNNNGEGGGGEQGSGSGA